MGASAVDVGGGKTSGLSLSVHGNMAGLRRAIRTTQLQS